VTETAYSYFYIVLSLRLRGVTAGYSSSIFAF